MDVRNRPAFLSILWTVILLPPIAWAVSQNVMFPLTEIVCSRHVRIAPFLAGVGCLVLALGAVLAGWRYLERLQHRDAATEAGEADDPNPTEEAGGFRFVQTSRFMLGLGIGIGVLFVLVIAVSIVPVYLLNPCPT